MQKVYLKKRKGFVKIALQRGASLVPIYYFGASLFCTTANTRRQPNHDNMTFPRVRQHPVVRLCWRAHLAEDLSRVASFVAPILWSVVPARPLPGNPSLPKAMWSTASALKGHLSLVQQVPITMAIGEPIDVSQVDNPTEEQINALHQRFVAALQQLFDEYKHKVDGDWRNKQLLIV